MELGFLGLLVSGLLGQSLVSPSCAPDLASGETPKLHMERSQSGHFSLLASPQGRRVELWKDKLVVVEKDGKRFSLQLAAGRIASKLEFRETGELTFLDVGKNDTVVKVLELDGRIRPLASLTFGGGAFEQSTSMTSSPQSRAGIASWVLSDPKTATQDQAFYAQVFNRDGKEVRRMNLPIQPAENVISHLNGDRFVLHLPGKDSITYRVVDANSKNDVELRLPREGRAADGKIVQNDYQALLAASTPGEFVVANAQTRKEDLDSQSVDPRTWKAPQSQFSLTKLDANGKRVAEYSSGESTENARAFKTADGYIIARPSEIHFLDEKLALQKKVPLPPIPGESQGLRFHGELALSDGRVAIVRSGEQKFSESGEQLPNAKYILSLVSQDGTQKSVELPSKDTHYLNMRMDELPNGRFAVKFRGGNKSHTRFQAYDRDMNLIAQHDTNLGFHSRWLPDGTFAIQEMDSGSKPEDPNAKYVTNYYRLPSAPTLASCSQAGTVAVDSRKVESEQPVARVGASTGSAKASAAGAH